MEGQGNGRAQRFVVGRYIIVGIVPRIRWAVTVLYAVVASVDMDARTGAEARRAEKRQDSRTKDCLVPVRRILQKFMVVADASPLGRARFWQRRTSERAFEPSR